MESWETASCYVTKKQQILEKIVANTETQSRFIHKREMTGLGRVLGERDVLLHELTKLNAVLAKDQTWKKALSLAPMIGDMTKLEQQLIVRSRQVLQEAVTERALIAAELKSSKLRGQVKSRYVNPWAMTTARGRLFNERG